MSYDFPIVSVVMPMYNVASYIKESLNSVLNQSFKHFEVICVDDGCTDETLDVLAKFKDPRVKIISQRNMGLAAARNTGIAAARGLYVALLDSDDVWLPNKLSKHVAHLNNSPEVGVSYCPSLFIDEQSNPMGIGQFPKLKDVSTKDIFCRNPVGNGSAAVMRKSMLFEVEQMVPFFSKMRPVYFDESMRQSEDIEFWLRVSLSTNWAFEGVDEPLTLYRVNSSGLSANLTKQYASWCYAVDKNRSEYPEFFKQWFSLANAYQLRYLSRRAVQSRNAMDAIKFMCRSLVSDFRVIQEEPQKTLLSLGCAFLSVLPEKAYSYLEEQAMQSFSNKRVSV